MPAINPMAVGIIAILPATMFILTDGSIKDQNDAETITPAAKPRSDFCNFADISLFVRNTTADPSTIPAIGINKPIRIVFIRNGQILFGLQIYDNLFHDAILKNEHFCFHSSYNTHLWVLQSSFICCFFAAKKLWVCLDHFSDSVHVLRDSPDV